MSHVCYIGSKIKYVYIVVYTVLFPIKIFISYIKLSQKSYQSKIRGTNTNRNDNSKFQDSYNTLKFTVDTFFFIE